MSRPLLGTRQLFRLVLRRDRIRLPVWVLAIGALVYASAGAVRATYSTPREIATYADTMGGSPTSVALAGPPIALNTIGGIVVNEIGMTALIGVALMAIFLVVRHTRAEEEQGRTELLRSTVVGREAGLAAALLEAALGSVLVGLTVTGSILVVDAPAEGAWLYGAAVAGFGFVMAGVASAAAQVTEHARGAIGLSLVALAVAFLLRAVGDVREDGLSWASPMGWSQQVSSFGDPRWWPLGFSVLLTVATVALAVELSARRDLGAGIVPSRPGPADAAEWLGTPFGLAWRLQRGALIGWTVGVFVFGLALGSFSRELTSMVEGNPEFAKFFGGSADDLVDSYLATILLIMSLMAAGFATSSALRLRSEETSGRLEPVLATGVSRTRAMLNGLLVTALGTALVVAAAGVGVGIAHAAVTGDADAVPRMLAYTLTYLPAVLVLSAVAALLFGWAPRLMPIAWALLALFFVMGYLGGVIDFPGWLTDLSPFTHTPMVPLEDTSAVPVLSVALVAGLLAAAGVVGFRRRDVTTA